MMIGFRDGVFYFFNKPLFASLNHFYFSRNQVNLLQKQKREIMNEKYKLLTEKYGEYEKIMTDTTLMERNRVLEQENQQLKELLVIKNSINE